MIGCVFVKSAYGHWANVAGKIKDSGLWKTERVITTPQGSRIDTQTSDGLINMCANNYLGLANDERVKQAAIEGIGRWGYGYSSVRFICGTSALHKELEERLSKFLGTEDTILYSSCYDANGGLFETILGEGDAVFSDELNHASIIDGIRLCKATRYRYKFNDIADLEAQLASASPAGIRAIVTDGVFSMDGTIANLKAICDLADKYDAIVIVDDSHGVGVVGENLRGAHEYCGVMERVDILTGTLGKALGGSSGGYTSGKKAIIDILRQRSRTYLFSNTLSPIIAAASLKVLDIVEGDKELAKRLKENTAHFRKGITEAGFDVMPGTHPIVPIMTYNELTAAKLAEKLLQKGVYVIGFFFPVVPRGKARIRCQVSAAHTKEQLDYVINAFKEAKDEV
jgi:glycine C-acetyltransferase